MNVFCVNLEKLQVCKWKFHWLEFASNNLIYIPLCEASQLVFGSNDIWYAGQGPTGHKTSREMSSHVPGTRGSWESEGCIC